MYIHKNSYYLLIDVIWNLIYYKYLVHKNVDLNNGIYILNI